MKFNTEIFRCFFALPCNALKTIFEEKNMINNYSDNYKTALDIEDKHVIRLFDDVWNTEDVYFITSLTPMQFNDMCESLIKTLGTENFDHNAIEDELMKHDPNYIVIGEDLTVSLQSLFDMVEEEENDDDEEEDEEDEEETAGRRGDIAQAKLQIAMGD